LAEYGGDIARSVAALVLVGAILWAVAVFSEDSHLFGPPVVTLDKRDQLPLRINRPNMVILCDAYNAAPNWKLTYVLSGPNQDAIAAACLE
jgi:hypothetical protein